MELWSFATWFLTVSLQILTDRSTADANNNRSSLNPYIGLDAGYVQVTLLLGTLSPLVVTPVRKSPWEGWYFLQEETFTDPFYQSQTFKGLYERQFHTLAYAKNKWRSVVPWNNATSVILQPGETRTYGLQFDIAPMAWDSTGQEGIYAWSKYILQRHSDCY